MKTWKHISEDNRKTICFYISHNKKLIEISKIINYDSNDANHINSRKGIDLNAEEFKKLDVIINDNKSIYQIKIKNKDRSINLFPLYIDMLIMVI